MTSNQLSAQVTSDGKLIVETAGCRWYLEEMPRRPIDSDFAGTAEHAGLSATCRPEYCARAIAELRTGPYAGKRVKTRIGLDAGHVLAIELAVAGRG